MARNAVATYAPIMVFARASQRIQAMLMTLDRPMVIVDDASAALRAWTDTRPAVVIVDQVAHCEAISETISAPILMVGDDIDAALAAGATDCVRFHQQLLTQRVTCLLDQNLHAYDTLPAMVQVLDKNANITYVNPEWLQTLGYAREEVLGRSVYDFMTDTSRHVAPRLNEKVWESGALRNIAFRYVKENGDAIEVLVDSVRQSDNMSVTVLRDITELKHAEYSLRESRQELESILRALPDMVVVLNRDGQFIRLVSEGVHRHNFETRAMIGRSVSDVLPEQAVQNILAAVDRTCSEDTIQHVHYDLHIGGRPTWHVATLSPFSNDEVLCVVRDVTEEKRTEASLLDSEKRYRSLFENATDAVLVVDIMSGQIIEANPQTTWLLGYGRDELRGMNIDEIESDDIAIRDDNTIEQNLTNRLVVETAYRRQDGTTVDVEVNSRVIQQDERIVLISFVRDISEQKQTLKEVQRQRNLAEVLLDTANALNGSKDLNAVLDRILHNVSQIIPHETSNIMTISGDAACITHHLGYPEAGFDPVDISDIEIPLNQARNLQWIIENKQALYIADVTDSSRIDWLIDTTAGYVRSLLTAPIINRGEVVGFINLDSTKPNNFNEEQAYQLLAFANQAAMVMEQATLIEELRESNEALEERVQKRTRELVQANKNLKNQIVQRQEVEDKLIAERTLLRTLIDNIPDHVYVKNMDKRLILANSAALNDLVPGRTFEDVLLKTNQEIFGDIPWALRHDQEDEILLQTEEAVINKEMWLEDADGTTRWLLVTKLPLRDPDGQLAGFIGINRDVTDLKQAEMRLAQERNLLRSIIDTIPNAIYVKDTESRFILANQATYQRIDGATSEADLIGKTDELFYPELADNLRKREIQIIESGEPQLNQSEMYYNADGTVTHLLVTKLPLFDADNKVVGIIGVNNNITELREAQDRLEQVLRSARCLLWSATVTRTEAGALDWQYKIVNESAAQEFFPFDKAGQTYTQAWLDAIPEADRTRREQVFERHVKHNKLDYRLEYMITLEGDGTTWLSEDVILKPMNKNQWQVVGVCIDIGARKAIEDKLKQLNEDLERRVIDRTKKLTEANAELISQIAEREKAEIAERRQRVIAEVIRDSIAKLSSTLDRDEIFDHLLSAIELIMPNDASNIMLVDGEEVVITRARGYESDIVGVRYQIADLPDLVAMSANQQPQIIDDVLEFEGWFDDTTVPWVRSNLSVPIILENEVIGFINMDSSVPGTFTHEQAGWIMTFGVQAGLAIRNASYTADLEQRVEERTRELDAERAQLKAILDGVTDGVVYTDMQRNPHYINRALETISGFSQEEWLSGQAQREINESNQDEINTLWGRVTNWLKKHDVYRQETLFNRKDGSRFEASLIRTAVKDKSNVPIGIVTVIRDISDEKRLQEQKERFITIAAHELRTPIANLKTRLFLMKRRPERFAEHIAVAENVVNLMQNLVEHMFDLSRFERGVIEISPEEVVLQDFLHEVLQFQAPQAERLEIALKVDMPRAPLTVMADPFRLTQVITNLISNALNYTPSKSEVLITVNQAEDDVLIDVQDDGEGIAPEHLPNLFQPFYRVSKDHRGAGLGLAIVHEIIKAHGGTITVESHKDRGTTFHIRLPLSQDINMDASNGKAS